MLLHNVVFLTLTMQVFSGVVISLLDICALDICFQIY